MAVRTKMGGFGTTLVVEKNQKKTSQGTSKNTKYSATSGTNGKRGIEDKEGTNRGSNDPLFLCL